MYTERLTACEADIRTYTEQIDAIQNYDETVRERRAKLKQSIDLLEDIVQKGTISNTRLRMLIDKIIIKETDGRLNITIKLNADFNIQKWWETHKKAQKHKKASKTEAFRGKCKRT